MGKSKRYWTDRLGRLSDAELAGVVLFVAAKARHTTSHRPNIFQMSNAVWRAWWADPFMKQAWLLVGLAVCWAHWVTPLAVTLTGRMGALLGSMSLWVLVGMPAVFAVAALCSGIDSARYRLHGPIIIGGLE